MEKNEVDKEIQERYVESILEISRTLAAQVNAVNFDFQVSREEILKDVSTIIEERLIKKDDKK